jgi:hypothetical protein
MSIAAIHLTAEVDCDEIAEALAILPRIDQVVFLRELLLATGDEDYLIGELCDELGYTCEEKEEEEEEWEEDDEEEEEEEEEEKPEGTVLTVNVLAEGEDPDTEGIPCHLSSEALEALLERSDKEGLPFTETFKTVLTEALEALQNEEDGKLGF